jgi:hypothetical protein
MNYKVRVSSSLILLAMSIGMSAFGNNAYAIDLDNAFIEASYQLGYRAEGATSDGSTLWIMDRGPSSAESFALRSYDISGGGFSAISLIPVAAGVGDTRGLAWDGTNIWTSSFSGSYFKLNQTNGNIVYSFVSTPTGSSGGLTYDGQYLWKASRPEFNQMDIATGNVVNTISGFDLPGIEEGLTYDGQFLYVISYGSGSPPRIWKIDPSSGALMSDSFALPSGTYNGLAFDGQSLWAVGWQPAQTVYKISVPSATELTIDIKPGDDPNDINLKSKGVIPVAILTTESFDASQVDWETVLFGPAGATESHGSAHIEDVDDDGDLDMVLHFNTRDTGIVCGDTEAPLTGTAFDGVAITGSDSINTVNCPAVDSTTITELVGDKDCFGFGDPCSDGVSVVDPRFGPDGDALVEPDDPLGTDQLGTSVPLGGPSFDFQFDIASLGLIGVTPTSASVTIFTGGIDLGAGPQFLFNGTNIGSYVEPFDQRNIAATVRLRAVT